MNRTLGNNVSDKMSATSKSFVQDTAEKLGVVPRTIERQIQTAKNLTPETKEIIKKSDQKISKEAALKLSRLGPEQQKEAAALLAAKEIRTASWLNMRRLPGNSIRRSAGTTPPIMTPYFLLSARSSLPASGN